METKLNKQRILIVLPNDNMGGAENVLKMIAEHYVREEVEIRFLTRSISGAWDGKENVRYGSFTSEYLGAFQLIFSLLFNMRKPKYDYVFTSHVFITGIIGILRRIGIIRTKYFVGRESTLIFKRYTGFKLSLYKFMYTWGYPGLDLLICQTDHMKEELLRAIPNLEAKVKVLMIPNPVDLLKISTLEDDVNIPIEAPYIVTAGRLIPEKGFDLLILAFKRLKYNYPNLKLIILGEGNERRRLTDLIADLKLSHDIILKGFVSNVFPYFRAAALCVVSSRIEGFPNVLLQMMSQNTKVVSTLCAGGISDILGVYTAPVNHEEALYNSIVQCLEDNNKLNRIIFDEFLIERSIERFMGKIEEALVVS
ncbi:glycosyltransferase [Sphingobacterium faecium]|uniref:glycosyltransferase n=1 Tax=Sphingobacterium faecium TaxID=34087 RepID=UPI00320814EC